MCDEDMLAESSPALSRSAGVLDVLRFAAAKDLGAGHQMALERGKISDAAMCWTHAFDTLGMPGELLS